MKPGANACGAYSSPGPGGDKTFVSFCFLYVLCLYVFCVCVLFSFGCVW